MVKMETWAGRSEFEYSGSVEEGTKIIYGSGFSQWISANQYQKLLDNFRGKTVNIGTSRTDPPMDSVGEWLINNVTKTAMASYVGRILIGEGYAQKGTGRAMITFFEE